MKSITKVIIAVLSVILVASAATCEVCCIANMNNNASNGSSISPVENLTPEIVIVPVEPVPVPVIVPAFVECYADTIYLAWSAPEAVCVKGSEFLYSGSFEGCKKFWGPNTVVYDPRGDIISSPRYPMNPQYYVMPMHDAHHEVIQDKKIRDLEKQVDSLERELAHQKNWHDFHGGAQKNDWNYDDIEITQSNPRLPIQGEFEEIGPREYHDNGEEYHDVIKKTHGGISVEDWDEDDSYHKKQLGSANRIEDSNPDENQKAPCYGVSGGMTDQEKSDFYSGGFEDHDEEEDKPPRFDMTNGDDDPRASEEEPGDADEQTESDSKSDEDKAPEDHADDHSESQSKNVNTGGGW